MPRRTLSARARLAPDWPIIPFLTFEATPLFRYSLWKAGNFPAATPERFDSTIISSSASINDFLADVDPYPTAIDDGAAIPEAGSGPVLYSRAGHNLTPKKNSVRKVEWDDSANVELFAETGAEVFSLQPSWKPDGSAIVFRSKATAGTLLAKIQTMAPDGTGVTTLYEAAAGDRVLEPYWNHDGTKIVWLEYPSTDLLFPRRIKSMNADGSGVATIYTPGGSIVLFSHAVANTQNVTAWLEADSTAFSSTLRWRKINLDGTGVTTLATQSRAVGYGSGDRDSSFRKWSWLPDDSAIVTLKKTPSDPSPDYHLVFLDPAGGGFTASGTSLYTNVEENVPQVLGDRIWFSHQIGGVGNNMPYSLALDGTDLRQEFDSDDPTSSASIIFKGFRADSLN